MTDHEEIKFNEYVDALEKLCRLKIIHEVEGNSDYYKENKEKAWKNAFALLIRDKDHWGKLQSLIND